MFLPKFYKFCIAQSFMAMLSLDVLESASEQSGDVATYIPRTGDSWASNPPEGRGSEHFSRKEDVGPSLILPCSIWLGTFIVSNHQDNIFTSQFLNGKTWTIHILCFTPWWCQPWEAMTWFSDSYWFTSSHVELWRASQSRYLRQRHKIHSEMVVGYHQNLSQITDLLSNYFL